MNSKNELQEFYQRLSLYRGKSVKDLVSYEVVSRTVNGNTPKYAVKVTTPDGEWTSGEFPKKRLAEIDAASIALDVVSSTNHKMKGLRKLTFKNGKCYVVVDIENYSDFFSKYEEWDVGENIKFIGVVSKGHSQEERKWPKDVRKFVVKSTRKDAADTAIIMFITTVILRDVSKIPENRKRKIFILSRDHFASTIQDCIDSEIVHTSTKVEHITGYKGLLDILS